jgi:hypothetical protein
MGLKLFSSRGVPHQEEKHFRLWNWVSSSSRWNVNRAGFAGG